MKISVALCTYNGDKYIGEQLNSILQQTQPVDEIIIVDDGSIDNTITISKEILNESNIDYKIDVNSKNLGVCGNFEKAISLCTGDIIFTSDQDDVWLDNKVERILIEFDDEKCQLVYTDAFLTDQMLHIQNNSLWEVYGFKKEINKQNIMDIMLNHNVVTGATMAFRKKILKESFPIPRIDGFYHDEWLALNALRFGQIKAINEKLIYYRQHNQNVVGAQKKNIIIKWCERIKILKQWNLYHTNKEKKVKIVANVLEKQIKNDVYELKLKECLEFWKTCLDIEKWSIGSALIWVLKNRKKYKLYRSGIKGMVREVISILQRNRV